MKKPKVELNWIEVKNERMRNFRERVWFVKFWAQFVRENPDELWSKGQADLIDSQFRSYEEFYKRLEGTEEGRKILERLKAERAGRDRL